MRGKQGMAPFSEGLNISLGYFGRIENIRKIPLVAIFRPSLKGGVSIGYKWCL